MGIISAILGWLGYHLGLRADAASATGSLHSKIMDVKNAFASVIKVRGPAGAYGSFSTNETAYQTALDITGKGRLVHLQAYKGSAGPSCQVGVKITLDGTVVSDCLSAAVTASTYFHPSSRFMFITNSAVGGLVTEANGGRSLIDLSFDTSLKIEVKYVTGGDAASVFWYYEIE